MATIATLTVDLIAESARFRSGLNKANNDAKKWSADTRKAVNQVGAAFAATSIAATTVGAAVVASAARAGEEVDRLSRLSNSTSEEFQRMAAGSRAFRIEQDKLSDILKDTNDKIGDFIATGGGGAADFFENIAPKVGVTAEQFKALSGPQALQLYYSSLERANLSQQELTFYMEALANDATMLAPLLADNGRELKALADRADNLGLILSNVQVEQLAQAGRDMDQVTEALGGLTNQLGARFAPLVSDLAHRFFNVAEEAGGFGEISTQVFNAVVSGAGYVADAYRGLEVVLKGVQALGQTGLALVAEGYATVVEQLEAAANGAIRLINSALEQANKIPGVSLSLLEEMEIGAADILRDFADSADRTATDTRKSLEELALKPLPREGIIQWAEEVSRKSTEAARKAVDEGVVGIAAGSSESLSAAAREALDQLKKDFAGVQAAGLTDAESETLRFDKQIETLQAAKLAGIEAIKPYDELEAQLAKQHEDRLTAIRKAGLTDREKFQELSYKDQAKTMVGTLAQFTQAAAQHDKSMFRANQLAGIANATISTYEGAAKALEWGYPLGPVFAGIITAAGLKNVQAIKNQQFGGSGGSAPSSVSYGGGPANPGVDYSSRVRTPDPTEDLEPGGGRFIFNNYGTVSGNDAERLLDEFERLIDERDTVSRIRA